MMHLVIMADLHHVCLEADKLLCVFIMPTPCSSYFAVFYALQ